MCRIPLQSKPEYFECVHGEIMTIWLKTEASQKCDIIINFNIIRMTNADEYVRLIF